MRFRKINKKRRDPAKFEKKFLKIFENERVSKVKVLLSSMALKLEITVLFGITTDLRDFHNSLGLPVDSESLTLQRMFVFCCNQF